MTKCANPSCAREFKPKRPDQLYCGPKCRMEYNAARAGDGALRVAVSRVSVLKGGDVSLVVRASAMDRHNALQIVPGMLVEILAP